MIEIDGQFFPELIDDVYEYVKKRYFIMNNGEWLGVRHA